MEWKFIAGGDVLETGGLERGGVLIALAGVWSNGCHAESWELHPSFTGLFYNLTNYP